MKFLGKITLGFGVLLLALLVWHVHLWGAEFQVMKTALDTGSERTTSSYFLIPPGKPYRMTIYAKESSPVVSCLLGSGEDANGKPCPSGDALTFSWSMVDRSGRSLASGISHGGDSFVTGAERHLVRGVDAAHVTVGDSGDVRFVLVFQRVPTQLNGLDAYVTLEAYDPLESEMGYEVWMGLATIGAFLTSAVLLLVARRRASNLAP